MGGLFIGFEMIDAEGNPGTRLASSIKNQMRERNILISTDGPFENVLKMKPPLCFSKENVDMVIENLDQILSTDI